MKANVFSIMMLFFHLFPAYGIDPSVRGFEELHEVLKSAVRELDTVQSPDHLPMAMEHFRALVEECGRNPDLVAVLELTSESCPPQLKKAYKAAMELQGKLHDASKRLAMSGMMQNKEEIKPYLEFMQKFTLKKNAQKRTEPQVHEGAPPETEDARDARMKWWRDGKFGMFIHYGLYSGLAGEWKGRPGGSEWIQKNVEVDTDTYAAEALPLFKPREGLTEEWAHLARDAGCQYVVLTSKHHEGFGLFDSALTDYDAKSAVNRDIIREYVDSCRKRGLKVGLYHSVIDWHHPSYDNTICPDLCYPAGQAAMLNRKNIPRDHAAYQKYLHAQVRELMTRYAPIDIMWWDYSQGAMEGAKGWKAPELMDMVRSINPGVIMNNRLYAYSGLNKNQAGTLDLRCGDYITPERFIPRRGYPGVDWESCMTVSDKWGYNRYDTNIKSPETIIEKLVECVTKGGNLLLNVNPMADGTIPEKVAATMRGVGRWLNINGEAVYGTRAFMQLDQPATINRQGDIFVFLIPPPDKGAAQPPSEGTMKELTAGAEHARMQPLDATGYEDDEGTAITLPAGYSKALLLGDNTALPVVNGTVLFKAHEHSKTPCSVIKLSK